MISICYIFAFIYTVCKNECLFYVSVENLPSVFSPFTLENGRNPHNQSRKYPELLYLLQGQADRPGAHSSVRTFVTWFYVFLRGWFSCQTVIPVAQWTWTLCVCAATFQMLRITVRWRICSAFTCLRRSELVGSWSRWEHTHRLAHKHNQNKTDSCSIIFELLLSVHVKLMMNVTIILFLEDVTRLHVRMKGSAKRN